MKRKIINPIIKDTITFIQTSDERKSKISELELTLMPKGGNFSHYHKTFTETFTAIDGALGLKLHGNKIKILQPNEAYSVPPNQVHSFFNPGNKEIRFNIKITPGHKGFENSLRILYGLAQDGLTDKKSIPKSLSHVAIIGSISDSYLPGVMKLLSPIFNLLAKKAKQSGLEEKLIDKYCN
ncbi:cupin domain-containing protein [Panacibacter ginsenosidivorans]|uniref:Cupin domain-containing protein n=1 Tax=Panacibacter ginsenosidivorans TaxID=1813871 RepID=A0A5B8VEW0_9BACT|nr:cupin domain-containing protein [Panacibacter ginsenosidivorans]QEC69541.1 cupin domain-containing protein [Panacibacter ginsenosidivorans]